MPTWKVMVVLNPGGPQRSPAHDYALPGLFSLHCLPVPSLPTQLFPGNPFQMKGWSPTPYFKIFWGGSESSLRH